MNNIQSLRRLDLCFWQTSKQIYGKLQYGEEVFGGFQGLLCFPRKMALYLLTRFGILKLWTNILWLTRFDLGYLQTSKQNNSKLQYSKKVFGKFQDLSRFSRKMVLYLSTKFGIIKPWTNILWNWSFDLGFSETSKQEYRKLQYREKVFGSFKICLAFPKKRFCIR